MCGSFIPPPEALKFARANPDRKVVFFAVGFETTAPANAMAVWQAKREGLEEFLDARFACPGAARDSRAFEFPRNRVQGFIAPGTRLHGHGLSRI